MVETVSDERCDELCVVYMAAFNIAWKFLLVFSRGS